MRLARTAFRQLPTKSERSDVALCMTGCVRTGRARPRSVPARTWPWMPWTCA